MVFFSLIIWKSTSLPKMISLQRPSFNDSSLFSKMENELKRGHITNRRTIWCSRRGWRDSNRHYSPYRSSYFSYIGGCDEWASWYEVGESSPIWFGLIVGNVHTRTHVTRSIPTINSYRGTKMSDPFWWWQRRRKKESNEGGYNLSFKFLYFMNF